SSPILRAKIADFGLAKQLDDDVTRTQTGAIIGTPSYMAPEQADGQTKEVGPATDVYALGAILYELLTGQAPFKGRSTSETLHLVKTRDATRPRRLCPQVPRGLENICLKCLEKQRERRYASAQALEQDLARWLAGKHVSAPSRLGVKYIL